MKTSLIMVLLTLACALGAIAVPATKPAADGIHSREPATASVVRWGEKVDGCRLGIDVSPESFTTGEPIEFDVILENSGSNNILASKVVGQAGPSISISATTADGSDVPILKTDNAPFSRRRVRVSAGESLRWSVTPSKFLDFSKPGVYTIALQLDVSEFARGQTQPAASQPTTISSSLTVRVIPMLRK